MEIKEKLNSPLNNNNMFDKFDSLFKFIRKSVPYEYECSACGEELLFKLTFDLIEEIIQNKEEKNVKNPEQYIVITAKPLVDKSKYLDKDSYIYGIKKSFTYNTYKEKFNFIDFKDSCIKYSNSKETNLLKIYNELIKCVKEGKSRIKINKYHLIFNYYLSDISDWNNSIMLTLDNEKEYNILECYEDANKKAYKIQYLNKKNKKSQSQNQKIKIKKEKNSRSPSKSDRRAYQKNKNNFEKYYDNNFNEINLDSHNSYIPDNYSNIVDKNLTEYENDPHSKIKNTFLYQNIGDNRYNNIWQSKFFPEVQNEELTQINQEKKYRNNNKENMMEMNIINDYNNIDSFKYVNKSASKEAKKMYNTNEKNKEKYENEMFTSLQEKECQKEKDKEISEKKRVEKKNKEKENKINKNINPRNPTKAEKEKIAKQFLYSEYNFIGVDDNQNIDKIDKKNEKNDGGQWDSSLYFDDDENKYKNFNKNGTIQNKNQYSENEVKFDSIEYENNNMNYLLGHKIYREQENKIGKNINKNSQGEKRNYSKISKKPIEEKKNNIDSLPIITISESDEETNIFDDNRKAVENRSYIPNKYIFSLSDGLSINRFNNQQNRYYDQNPRSLSNNLIPNYKFIPNNNYNHNHNPNELPYSPSLFNSNQIPKENTSNKLLLKYMSEKSNIINNVTEIKIIKDKIEQYRDLYFKLVYTSNKDKDDYDTFKNAVIDNYRHLILVKTTKERRFAIYFNEQLFSSKGNVNQEIIDMMGFLFSFDKYIFYEPSERLNCFTQSPKKPYLFQLSDYSLYIKNNFKKCEHHFGQSSRIFNIQNLCGELNGGEKKYFIDVLEIFRAEIPNK